MRSKIRELVAEWRQDAIIMQGRMECLHSQGLILEAAATAQRLEFFHGLIQQVEATLKSSREGWCDQEKGGDDGR